jgi:hypothetical protein
MPRTGFEHAIPMFARRKTVPALDRSAIETGVIKSMSMIWTVHVTPAGEVRNAYEILVGNTKGNIT